MSARRPDLADSVCQICWYLVGLTSIYPTLVILQQAVAGLSQGVIRIVK